MMKYSVFHVSLWKKVEDKLGVEGHSDDYEGDGDNVVEKHQCDSHCWIRKNLVYIL
jgi:hypothetical protein